MTDKGRHFTFSNELGFALMLIGMQFGTALRNVFGIELVYPIMAISILLIIDYNSKFKLFSISNPLWLLLLFHGIELIYRLLYNERNVISYTDNEYTLNKAFYYHSYVICCILALATHKQLKEFKYFPRILLYLSGFISLVVCYQSTLGFSQLSMTNVFSNNDLVNQLTVGGDKINLGRALLLCLLTCVVYKGNYIERYIRIGLFISSFIGLFMFNTRASIGCFFIALIYYLWTRSLLRFNVRSVIKLFIRTIPFILIAIILYYNIEYVNITVNKFSNSFTNGLLTFLNMSSQSLDESALIRVHKISSAKEVFFNGSMFELLFGHGYYSMFLDVPIFQIFLDNGIIIGFLFIYLMVILPVKLLMKKSTTPSIIILKMFMIQYLLDLLYGGSPYWYTFYMPLIIVLFIDALYTKNRRYEY